MFSSMMFSSTGGRDLCLTVLVCIAFLSSSFAQQPFATSRGDNTRSAANTNETLLTPPTSTRTASAACSAFPSTMS